MAFSPIPALRALKGRAETALEDESADASDGPAAGSDAERPERRPGPDETRAASDEGSRDAGADGSPVPSGRRLALGTAVAGAIGWLTLRRWRRERDQAGADEAGAGARDAS